MVSVLFVEDDPTVRLVVNQLFSRFRQTHELVVVENGLVALQILRQRPIDVVVTDLMMPVMDGFELIAALSCEFPDLPIIVATALEMWNLEKLTGIGSFRILRKPFEINALKTAIDTEVEAVKHGAIFGVTLASFLQLVEVERKSCTVRVVAGGEVGYLFFEEGSLVDAEIGSETGLKAANRIVVLNRPEIQITPPTENHRKSIDIPLSNVLLEAFRIKDESLAAAGIPVSESIEPDIGIFRTTKPKGFSGKLGNQITQTGDVYGRGDGATLDSAYGPGSAPAPAGSSFAESISSESFFSLTPTLKKRLKAGELPQQTADLLIFIDGKTTFGELAEILPDQVDALRMLISGLTASGLLIEGSEAFPEETEFPVPPLPDRPVFSPPETPFFLPSDGLLLTQMLRMSHGSVPPVLSLEVIGLPEAYHPAFSATFTEIASYQPADLGKPAAGAEAPQIHLRPDLSIELGFHDPEVPEEAKPTLGRLFFLSAHQPVTDAAMTSLFDPFPDFSQSPHFFTFLNCEEGRESLVARVCSVAGLSEENVVDWDIQNPRDMAQTLNRLIQNLLLFL